MTFIKKNILSIAIYIPYILAYILFALEYLTQYKHKDYLMATFPNKIKFYTAYILIVIIFSLLIFFIQYIIIKFLIKKKTGNEQNIDKLGAYILISDATPMVFSLFLISYNIHFFSVISGIGSLALYYYFLKSDFQKNGVRLAVIVKFIFNLINIIFYVVLMSM